MAEYHYDVVIIGAGPAGEGAAMNAAKKGKKVAVVEEAPPSVKSVALAVRISRASQRVDR